MPYDACFPLAFRRWDQFYHKTYWVAHGAALMSLHFHFLILSQTQFDTKSYLLFTKPGADGGNASSSSSLSAALMKVMSEKVIKTQCTFHPVSLAPVSLKGAFNKSEWQPGSFVSVCRFLPLCCFIPCVSLSCPSSSGHTTQILIPASLVPPATKNTDVTQNTLDR